MRSLNKRPRTVSILLIITLALATLVASCASPATPQVVSKPQPTPTETIVPPAVEPTTMPTATPPTKAQETPEAAAPDLPAEILNLTWYWERYADTAGMNDFTVKDPGKYTLTLLSDGTFQLLVDCNRASGAYTVDGSRFTLNMGPATMAFCGEDSRHDQYLRMLGDVVTFVMDNAKLVLNLKMDAGNMIFASELPLPLPGTTWKWTTASDASAVADPGKYTVTFNADGTVTIQADCNRAFGSYNLEGDALTFGPLGMTRMMCQPGSRDQQFVSELGSVRSFGLVDGKLVLTTDAGEMTLVPHDPLAGTTWQWTETSDGGAVSPPERYSLSFLDADTVSILADCNRAAGAYQLNGAALTIAIGPMTLAECGPGSLYYDFVAQLGAVQGYSLEGDGTLMLRLSDGAGIKMAPAPTR